MHPITAATRHRPFMFFKLLYLRTAFPKKNCNRPLQVLLSYSLSCPVSLSSFLLLLTLVIVELELHVSAGKKHIISIIQVLSLTFFLFSRWCLQQVQSTTWISQMIVAHPRTLVCSLLLCIHTGFFAREFAVEVPIQISDSITSHSRSRIVSHLIPDPDNMSCTVFLLFSIF